MNRQLFAGLFTEGTTDVRFLEPIVEKTLAEIAFECKGNIEIEVKTIEIVKTNLNFVEQVQEASKKGIEDFGIMLLCVHTDADDITDRQVRQSKIQPAKEFLSCLDENRFCKIVAAIIPIQMTEAWMLADTTLLKEQIGTTQSDAELGLHRNPEEVNNPKNLIREIIRATQADRKQRQRGRELDISDLYQIIGQSLELSSLERLSSYQNFKQEVREALITLNFL
ncbi:DUF4276 family protein [Thermoflexibacter ruber]|uniref:DUF4276 domain-containing protein n=1 Tax=Thermoflexibacter ruber TaxID=1003 RepID=A0A1I2GAV0_9BACT|nr:DUF4276 family protein [Thermoflexibacter ruber]SFF14100.1 protein of unknown function [Thermoflexibacter ruber]